MPASPDTTFYRYNPACTCPWCENHGVPPTTPDTGHSHGYGNPHTPAQCLHCRTTKNVRSYTTRSGTFGEAWTTMCDQCLARTQG